MHGFPAFTYVTRPVEFLRLIYDGLEYKGDSSIRSVELSNKNIGLCERRSFIVRLSHTKQHSLHTPNE